MYFLQFKFDRVDFKLTLQLITEIKLIQTFLEYISYEHPFSVFNQLTITSIHTS